MKLKPVFLDERALRAIANNIAQIYPYSEERIFNVILQVRSLDLAISIVDYCCEFALTLDSGVYLWLKGRDENV